MPDAYALIKLADFFNVSIDYLVCRVDSDLSSDAKRQRLISKIQEELEDLRRF